MTDPRFQFQGETLEHWLDRLEAGADDALEEGDDETLLFVLGILDHLAVGDVATLSDSDRRELAGAMASVQLVSGTDAFERGFRSTDVRGRISLEERDKVDRLREEIRAELDERWHAPA